MVIWLIGPCGSRKRSVAQAVHRHWAAEEPAAVLVDESTVQRLLASPTGSPAHPDAGLLVGRIGLLATWLDSQGIEVVVDAPQLPPDGVCLASTQAFLAYVAPPLKGLSGPIGRTCLAPAPPHAPDLVVDVSRSTPDVDDVANSILSWARRAARKRSQDAGEARHEAVG